MIDNNILQKSLKVWESPVFGNAVVVLKGVGDDNVLVGDLDGGIRYIVPIIDLKVPLRNSEPDDYGFSWTGPYADWDIVCHVDELNS